jgi:hypothetical protein
MAPKAKLENKSKTVHVKVRSHLVKAIAPAVNPSGVVKSKGSRILTAFQNSAIKLSKWLLWYILPFQSPRFEMLGVESHRSLP